MKYSTIRYQLLFLGTQNVFQVSDGEIFKGGTNVHCSGIEVSISGKHITLSLYGIKRFERNEVSNTPTRVSTLDGLFS